MDIKTTYVKDSNGNDVAVVIDIATFEEIRETIEEVEDVRIIEMIEDEPTISLDDADISLQGI